jgi:hypothetical protein
MGGGQDVRFMQKRRNYLKHNIFKIISQLERTTNQTGGAASDGYLSTSSDDETMKKMKDIILAEVNKLNEQQRVQLGGNCGCGPKLNEQQRVQLGGNCGCGTKSNEQNGGAKKNKKSKKSKDVVQKKTRKHKSRKQKGGDTDSDSSGSSSDSSYESSYESSSESDTDDEGKYGSSLNHSGSDDSNSDSQKGGLSIFPFNSSEVKSTVSEKKNMRMIRRKI